MSGHSINPCNHDIFPPEAPLVNVQVDGEWVQVPKGMNLIEVARRHGKFIPHYCYHPKLQVVGNCRMCLIEMGTPKMSPERKPIIGADGKPEINWMPRPQIACASQASEGLGIRTDSPLTQECRKAVMEFLLINHPLDCPICDQAGECKLQEFSSEYGTGTSRFVEQKVHKPKHQDLGARIVLDDERCILCSRCVRFARDVVKDDVLGFVNRGSYNTLTSHPDKKFDNDYSLNTVDICPVGALTSKDFRFKMRVWFLKETETICTGCATGCNVTVGSREDVVYRLTPRGNEEVNSDWMCDFGRLDFHDLGDSRRISQPQSRAGAEHFSVPWQDVFLQIGQRLAGFKPGEVALIGSARMTNEELYLFKKLAEDLKIELFDIIPREWPGDSFLKSKDKNPNSAGAKLVKFSSGGSVLPKIKEGIESGRIRGLISFHEDATAIGLSRAALEKLSLLIAASILPNDTTTVSHFILPSGGFAEKRGSMVNAKGRLQRLHKAVNPPGSMEDWEIINSLRKAAGSQQNFSSFEEVFKSLSADVPLLAGLNLGKIGDKGVQLDLSKA